MPSFLLLWGFPFDIGHAIIKHSHGIPRRFALYGFAVPAAAGRCLCCRQPPSVAGYSQRQMEGRICTYSTWAYGTRSCSPCAVVDQYIKIASPKPVKGVVAGSRATRTTALRQRNRHRRWGFPRMRSARRCSSGNREGSWRPAASSSNLRRPTHRQPQWKGQPSRPSPRLPRP